MKIYKIASSTPPPGFVHVKLTAKMDGTFDAKLVAHGPGTGCKLENDDALIQDILDAEVAGFGKTQLVEETTSIPDDSVQQKGPRNPFHQKGPFQPQKTKQIEEDPHMGFAME